MEINTAIPQITSTAKNFRCLTFNRNTYQKSILMYCQLLLNCYYQRLYTILKDNAILCLPCTYKKGKIKLFRRFLDRRKCWGLLNEIFNVRIIHNNV